MLKFSDYQNSVNNISKAPLVLYAAGLLGKLILESLKQKNITVDYFCDRDEVKWNTEIKGVKIDNFFDDNTLSKINFMNITVDVNELSALKGMPNFINKKNLKLILIRATTDQRIKICFNYLKNYDFKYIYYFPKNRDLIAKNFIHIFFDYFLKSSQNFKELNQNELTNDSLKIKYNMNILFSKQKLVL